MSDEDFITDEEIDNVQITDKGQKVVADIEARFAGGETIESIAQSYELEVEAVQVLMMLDTILKENS